MHTHTYMNRASEMCNINFDSNRASKLTLNDFAVEFIRNKVLKLRYSTTTTIEMCCICEQLVGSSA